MPSLRSIPRSGVCRLLLPLLLLTSACLTRYGFAGGGLPQHIRTMAILPFDNETPTPELSRELYEQMRRELQPRLGVRDAPEKTADAVVRGIIRIYDVDVPVGYQANQTTPTAQRRKLQITLDVQIIDQTTGKAIFERKGLRAEGDYPEGGEKSGRQDAIKRIVNDMVEGAQSQW
ncbi:MAG: LPS assembly lipoprotein LptE [Gemmatimonadaceae bacterium]